ncbi:MAG: alpha/beta hydrolase domain-containing protein [Bryobacteraceae bacterium]
MLQTLRCLLPLLCLAALHGEVTGVTIHKREPYSKGRVYGAAGAYELIEGVMRFAVNPTVAANQSIVDIANAPRNAQGLVEFEADFQLVKPADASKGNGALLFDVVNRGNFRWHSTVFRTPESAQTSADFLLTRGFTVLAIGWQHDVPASDGEERLLRARVPVATLQGKPIRGLVGVTFTLAKPADTQLLSDRGHIPYPVADPNAPGTRLTIKHLDGRTEIVPREKWGFRGKDRIYMDGGFAGARSYEVIYQSENPPVAGLGFAAVRDGVAAVKRAKVNEFGIRSGAITRALAVGQSQSGRFLRGFVHEGFNADLDGNRVFDGVLAVIAGGSRVTINYRFAQPSANPGLFFPYTDAAQTDPETKESGGLLANVPAAIRPKMMYLNTSNEYWRSSNAALIHLSGDGSRDFPLPEDSRLYVVAGAQHGPGPWPAKKADRELAGNPLNYRWVTRAAFLALDRWVTGTAKPPASRYPRLDQNQLTPSDQLGFPSIPGVTPPPSAQTMARAMLPANFWTAGPVTTLPPRAGKLYPHLVSRVNADGNEIGGILLPELTVPLGTYLGWNQQFPGARDMNASLGLPGGFVPFSRDEEQRKAHRDPRPSLAARYANREDFLGKMALAALQAAKDGYLLEEDIASLLRTARRQYDDMAAGK